MRNQLVNNAFIIVFTICILYVFSYFAVYINDELTESKTKPISYPEEIQAVRAGDTLYVSSVSDSIYIGFKQFKNK
jgi:hypothetical protein